MDTLKYLSEKYQTLLITSEDLNLPESDHVKVFLLKGDSTHRYNFAWIKALRKSLREDQINQIVICASEFGLGSSMNDTISFNFNMATFLHGQKVDFISTEQYQTISQEQLIVRQCVNLMETDDIHTLIKQGKIRLVGAIIQPDGYWRTIFINGFEVNQQQSLN